VLGFSGGALANPLMFDSLARLDAPLSNPQKRLKTNET
jgi:hypothetical protein